MSPKRPSLNYRMSSCRSSGVKINLSVSRTWRARNKRLSGIIKSNSSVTVSKNETINFFLIRTFRRCHVANCMKNWQRLRYINGALSVFFWYLESTSVAEWLLLILYYTNFTFFEILWLLKWNFFKQNLTTDKSLKRATSRTLGCNYIRSEAFSLCSQTLVATYRVDLNI